MGDNRNSFPLLNKPVQDRARLSKQRFESHPLRHIHKPLSVFDFFDELPVLRTLNPYVEFLRGHVGKAAIREGPLRQPTRSRGECKEWPICEGHYRRRLRTTDAANWAVVGLKIKS